MPLHSLRARVVLTMVAILAVTIGAAALLFSRITQVSFQRYVMAGRVAFESRFADLLADHWAKTGSWAGVDPVLDQVATLSGRRPLLLDSLDHPVASRAGRFRVHQKAAGTIVIEKIPEGPREVTVQIAIQGGGGIRGPDGRRVGRLVLIPSTPPTMPPGLEGHVPPHAALPGGGVHALEASRSDRAFLGSVNRSLIFVVLGAGLLALLLTAAFARRVLAPVEALTAAVRGLEPGRTPPRVEVRGRDEIAALSTAFNAMAERVSLAERLRRDLVSDVAHELRTPLQNLRGQIEALEDGLVPPDRERLASLHEEVLLLGRLVADLQELAQAEAGQIRLARRPLPPREEIERAVASVAPRADAAGIGLEIDVPEGLPEVDADRSRLAQVLRNLLENALAHTPSGGVVTAAARPTPGAVAFEVRDTGEGIAPEHQPHVFDRFYRTDPSRSRETGGAGLGLAIVKQLVEAHGGTVRLASAPGAGSSFGFTIPTVDRGAARA